MNRMHPQRNALGRALVGWLSWLAVIAAAAATSPLELTSSSPELVRSFDWNKAKALSWVRTGVKPQYIPCYWAGYNYREAFYVRDIAHQCVGAAVLGLNRENLSMWQAFARTATESRQWFCLWALGFDGQPYAVDYHSDTNFVREIPAPLELVDKAETCYRWSGNPRWLTDPVLTQFYHTTLNDFLARHEETSDGLAQGRFVDIFEGACGSYCEGSAGGYGIGADNLATTWSANLAYARLLRAMGRGAAARHYDRRAEGIRRSYVRDWWNPAANNYYAGRTIGLGGWITNFDQYSKETYDFQAVKGLAEPGPKAEALLACMDQNYRTNRSNYNFESFTYLPEAFYNYGQNERGWYWLKCLMDSHYEYPEVSYTAIGSLATGLLGIEPDAPHQAIATLGRLPAAITWVQLDHIPVGNDEVMVRHANQNHSTTVRNNSGPHRLQWEARFAGYWDKLLVDGIPRQAKHRVIQGVASSYTTVSLAPRQAATVTTGALSSGSSSR